jgi:hypothetical protein
MSKRFLWMVAVLLVACHLCLGGSATKKPPLTKPSSASAPQSQPDPQVAEMTRVLSLSAEQQVKLKTALDAARASLAKFDAENGPRVAQLQKDLAAANKLKDEPSAAKARSAIDGIASQRMAVQSAAQREVENVLTDPQRIAWLAYSLQSREQESLKKVALTDEQNDKIRQLCLDAGKQMSLLIDEPSRQQVQTKLQGKVLMVLTPQQRATVEGKPLPKPTPTKTK